jgi:phosphoglycolate phosphatase-like HAD superfamily hydrolase
MTAAATKKPLEAVLDQVGAAPGSLVVFDLDDTLFSTGDRHLRILREYADLVEAKAPSAAELLRAIDRERLRYQIVDTVRDAGLKDDALVKDLRDFWFARFFKNHYLLEDSVIPGAPEPRSPSPAAASRRPTGRACASC